MAISRIASQDATAIGDPAVATYPARPTRGNLLLAAAASTGDGAPLIVSPGWHIVTQTGSSYGSVLYYKIAGDNESQTVTTSTDTFGAGEALAIYEYTGFPGTPSVSAYVANTPTTSLTYALGPTTAVPTLQALAFVFLETQAANTVSTWTNSFVTRNTVRGTSTAVNLITADLIGTTSQAFSTTLTMTGTASGNAGAIVVFTSGTQFIGNRGIRPRPFAPGLAR